MTMRDALAAALTCAALAIPATARADESMGAATNTATSTANMATLMCRAAAPNEKPFAMTTGTAPTALVCKPISAQMMKKGAGGPDLRRATTPQQADDAWREFILNALLVQGNA